MFGKIYIKVNYNVHRPSSSHSPKSRKKSRSFFDRKVGESRNFIDKKVGIVGII